MRPSTVGPRPLCEAKSFCARPEPVSGLYAPPTVTMSFAVAGVPIVPEEQADRQLPAAKRIVMSGWAQTNASTIRAWVS